MTASECEPAWYLEASDGRIAWTEEGIAVLGPHFARAGISIRSVRTRAQLNTAYRAASPYLEATLLRIARRGPSSLERQALEAITVGDHERFNTLLAHLERRAALGLHSVPSGAAPSDSTPPKPDES